MLWLLVLLFLELKIMLKVTENLNNRNVNFILCFLILTIFSMRFYICTAAIKGIKASTRPVAVPA